MELLTQAYLVSSLSVGLLVLAGIFSIYLGSRNRLVLTYIIFQVIFIVHILFYLVYFYMEQGLFVAAGRSWLTVGLALSCDLVSFIFLILIPYLLSSLFEREHRGKISLPFVALFVLNLVVTAPFYLIHPASSTFSFLRKLIFALSLTVVTVYSTQQLLTRRGEIVKPLKWYSISLGLLTTLFTPFVLLYDFLSLGSQLFSPLLFLVANIMAVIFFTKHALSLAVNFNTTEPSASFYECYGITPRERDIVVELLKGTSYKEMTEKLFISINTVKKHVNNIYRKAEVKNRMELLQKATKTRGE